ncbi:MAG TPA: aldo/keto reductase [Micromonosporaceae bacterium]|jgi:aryl-alcohol dehydrogenase-like predicted oxidoreductase
MANAATAGTVDIGGDLLVNRLGFGAMRITGDGIWGPPRDHGAALTVLRRAVEMGVNFIDTANSYGPQVSENLIAEALLPYPDDLVIATKAGLERPGPNRWTPNGRPEYLVAECEGSLRRLGLEQIPLFQLHRPDPKVPLTDSVGALVQLKEQGKIRHIGLSNVSEAEIREAQQVATIVSVQNRYNVNDRDSESIVDLCEADGLAFLPWAPIREARGNRAVDELAQRYGATPYQVVLAWLLARSPAVLPIPGTSTPAHLEENVAAVDLALMPEDVASLTNG